MLPGVERQLVERAGRAERAGVVEEDVEPVEAGEQRGHRLRVADVGGADDRALVAGRGLLQRLAAAPGEHDAVALVQQRARDGAADAGPGAGDEGNAFHVRKATGAY